MRMPFLKPNSGM
uniref:Uncharacterized protein n=1 Tax=Lepeophtheirus salmonis TaxID=72036 RepID=A0A0K2SZU9_LEPSM